MTQKTQHTSLTLVVQTSAEQTGKYQQYILKSAVETQIHVNAA